MLKPLEETVKETVMEVLKKKGMWKRKEDKDMLTMNLKSVYWRAIDSVVSYEIECENLGAATIKVAHRVRQNIGRDRTVSAQPVTLSFTPEEYAYIVSALSRDCRFPKTSREVLEAMNAQTVRYVPGTQPESYYQDDPHDDEEEKLRSKFQREMRSGR